MIMKLIMLYEFLARDKRVISTHQIEVSRPSSTAIYALQFRAIVMVNATAAGVSDEGRCGSRGKDRRAIFKTATLSTAEMPR